MTQNLFAGAQISRHETSQGTLETSNPTNNAMADLFEFHECIECEKFAFHWESSNCGSSRREIC